MNLKMICGFHWITKMVILLTGLLLGLLLIAFVMEVFVMPHNYMVSNGLGAMILSLAWILIQVFLFVLIIIALYTAVMRIKIWIEKYLDTMLAKLDALSEQKSHEEDIAAAHAVMHEKAERIEKKLDSIKHILKDVAE